MEKIFKILVLDNTSLDTKLAFIKAKKYFAERDINVSYFTKKVNELVSVHEYLKKEGFNTKTGKPDTISWKGLDDIVKDNCRKYVKEGEYDCVIFFWDVTQLNHPLLGNEVVTAWSHFKPLYNGTEFTQIQTSQYSLDSYPEELWKVITHENLHSFCYALNRKGYKVIDEMDNTLVGGVLIPFYKNDDPFAIEGNYSHTLKNIKPYLSKLYKDTSYKWFSQAEVDKYKLVPELWEILDKMRENAQTPFIITSGLRTTDENKKAGGKPNSAHLRGMAVDLACNDNFKRAKMLKGIMPFIKDIFLEIAPRHLHIDIDYKIHELGQVMFLDKE